MYTIILHFIYICICLVMMFISLDSDTYVIFAIIELISVLKITASINDKAVMVRFELTGEQSGRVMCLAVTKRSRSSSTSSTIAEYKYPSYYSLLVSNRRNKIRVANRVGPSARGYSRSHVNKRSCQSDRCKRSNSCAVSRNCRPRDEQRTATQGDERGTEIEKYREGSTYRRRSERVLLLAHSRIFFFSQPSTVFTHSSPGLRQSLDMNGILRTREEFPGRGRHRRRESTRETPWSRDAEIRDAPCRVRASAAFGEQLRSVPLSALALYRARMALF